MHFVNFSKEIKVKKEYDVIVCGGGVAGVAAAGHAASLSIEEGVGIADVNIKLLQANLEKDNVMVHFPDSYIPEDRTVILHGKNATEIDGGHL